MVAGVFIVVVPVIIVIIVIVVIVVIIVHAFLGELHGIHRLTKRHYPGLIRAGASYQILQPKGLQFETDSEHDIRIGHPGDVAGSRLVTVRIATRRQHAEDLHPISTYHASPVSHEVGGGHYLDRRPRGRSALLGGRWLRFLRCLGVLVISTGAQESYSEYDKAYS